MHGQLREGVAHGPAHAPSASMAAGTKKLSSTTLPTRREPVKPQASEVIVGGADIPDTESVSLRAEIG